MTQKTIVQQWNHPQFLGLVTRVRADVRQRCEAGKGDDPLSRDEALVFETTNKLLEIGSTLENVKRLILWSNDELEIQFFAPIQRKADPLGSMLYDLMMVSLLKQLLGSIPTDANPCPVHGPGPCPDDTDLPPDAPRH